MKVLVATEKPFAAAAVNGIKAEIESPHDRPGHARLRGEQGAEDCRYRRRPS